MLLTIGLVAIAVIGVAAGVGWWGRQRRVKVQLARLHQHRRREIDAEWRETLRRAAATEYETRRRHGRAH
jgi:hypothetical protein